MFAWILLCLPAWSADWFVPGDSATIDGAVALASTGDTIIVDAGTYTESLVLDKDLTLVGAGLSNTVLAWSSGDETLEIRDGAVVTVEGFTISGMDSGRGIEVNGSDSALVLRASDIELTRTAGSDTRGGASLLVDGGEAVLEDVDMRSAVLGGAGFGGHVAVYAGELSATDTSFLQGTGTLGAQVYANSSQVALIRVEALSGSGDASIRAVDCIGGMDEVTLRGGTSPNSGAGAFLAGGIWTVSDTVFEDNVSDGAGGHLYTSGAFISIEGGAFTGGEGTSAPGIFANGGSLSLSGVLFEDQTGVHGSHVVSTGGNSLVVDTSTFTAGVASNLGGAIRMTATAAGASITNSTFTDHRADAGGAILVEGGSLTALRNQFCLSDAHPDDGGHIQLQTGNADIANNVFLLGDSNGDGAAISVQDAPNVVIRNNTFVENAATGGGSKGAAVHASGNTTSVDLRNNIIAHNTGDHAVVAMGSAAVVYRYNVFFDNPAGDVSGGTQGPGNLYGTDPAFQDYQPGNCASDLRLDAASAVIDAGDPLDSDPDGSPSDPGAWGGPDAPAADWEDDDGDGWPVMWDCDETDPTLSPGADEVCDDDDVDEDCDGLSDNDDPSVTNTVPTFPDEDGDSYGASGPALDQCPEPGRVANDLDCDDTDPDVQTAVNWYPDDDGDGHGASGQPVIACSPPSGYVAEGDDCDDTDPNVFQGGTVWKDGDGDGYGDPSTQTQRCGIPSGFVKNDLDCDDGDADLNPDADELCNGIDDDCDGETDNDAVDAIEFFVDADGDGFGDPSQTGLACAPGDGLVDDDTDCDDAAPFVNPGALEQCDNLVDDDCDGDVDEATVDQTWYPDADGDGYGVASGAIDDCQQPSDHVLTPGDCDDANPNVNPGADEVWYDGIDDDCDGRDDDQDEDGFGIAEDCDDTDPAFNPSAEDIPGNGVDENCDGADATDLPEEGRVWSPEVDDTEISGGCACSTGGSPVSPAWLLVVALVATRRWGQSTAPRPQVRS